MPSVLAAHALVELERAKFHCKITSSSETLDNEVERFINRASGEIESFLGTHVITRGSLVEDHSIRESRARIWTRYFPIISVTEILEDTGRDFLSSSALTAETDFVVSKKKGKITRVSGGGYPTPWLFGHRVVRVTYTAGYANIAAVPDLIATICLDMVAHRWRHRDRDVHGIASKITTANTSERYVEPGLSKAQKAALRRGGFTRHVIEQTVEPD